MRTCRMLVLFLLLLCCALSIGFVAAQDNSSDVNGYIVNISNDDTDLFFSDVNEDIATLSMSQSGKYYHNTSINFKLVNSSGCGVSNAKINLIFSNGQKTSLNTDTNGNAIYLLKFLPGKYSINANVDADNILVNNYTGSVNILKIPITLKTAKLTTYYKSGKLFNVKITNSITGKALSGIKVKLKVFTGKKSKTVMLTTNSKGIASYKASLLQSGSHKILISTNDNRVNSISKSSLIKINKRNLFIYPVPVKDKDFDGVVIAVVVKKTMKFANGVKLKLKIYSGKKYKTVYLVSGYSKDEKVDGTCGWMTNMLSKGSHKIIITTVNKNDRGYAKTKIVVKKLYKKSQRFSMVFSKGKLSFC